MSNQTNYSDIICQAIDEIVSKRIEGISFDNTILCIVTDDTKRKSGQYKVQQQGGNWSFDAVSVSEDYREGDSVYVHIPNNDRDQQKTIISKKVNNQEQPYIYKRPFGYLVDITGNVIENQNNQYGLVANETNPVTGDYTEVLIFEDEVDDDKYMNYTRIGLQSSFRSLLNPFYVNSEPKEVVKGEYGIRVKIYANKEEIVDKSNIEQPEEDLEELPIPPAPIAEEGEVVVEEKTPVVYILELNCGDMNGNPYNFQTFYLQEKVFNISEIKSISKIQVYFYQKGGFKSNEDIEIPCQDWLGNTIAPNLYAKDIYLTFGYDVGEFEDEMITIYTLDSPTYSNTTEPIEGNNKLLQLRWIHKTENGLFKSIQERDDLNYELYWYRYSLGSEAADNYSGVYWQYLSKQIGNDEYITVDQDLLENNDNIVPEFFKTWLVPDINVQTEQVKAILIYGDKAYHSNVLRFENQKEVISQATVDALSALSIRCDDGTSGNYFVYGQNRSALDRADTQMERTFTAMFKIADDGEPIPLNEIDKIEKVESIEWIIPKHSSMIEVDLESDYIDDRNEDEDFVHFIANGEQVKDLCTLPYKIESFFSQSNSNNIVKCIIVKEKITYMASFELSFGVAGTCGTPYTFVLDFAGDSEICCNLNDDKKLTVVARLYDYSGKEIPLPGIVSWSWKDGSDLGSGDTIEINKQSILNTGTLCNILQATVKVSEFDLTAYLPIPRGEDTTNRYISGLTQIIYDSSGRISDTFRNPYVLYDGNGEPIEGVVWTVQAEVEEDEPLMEDRLPYGVPRLNYDNVLEPLSFYIRDVCDKIYVRAEKGSSVLWSQPILILQNQYPVAMLNEWDGSLDVGETDPGTILAPRLAAGKKNTDDNTFSGVILGDWSQTDSEENITRQTGIYGFDHGEQSYAFKEDGTAFIGKSGMGRIVFDGIHGTIGNDGRTSPDDEKLGTLFDLDDGILDITGNYSSIRLSQGVYGENKDRESPFFEIKTRKNPPVEGEEPEELHTLIHIGKEDYVLQTYDWVEDPKDGFSGAGTKFDLGNGKFRSYDFDLKGVIPDGQYKGSAIRMAATPQGNDPFFRIWYCKYKTEEANPSELEDNLALIDITKTKFLMHSPKWSEEAKTGLEIDLIEGKITSFNGLTIFGRQEEDGVVSSLELTTEGSPSFSLIKQVKNGENGEESSSIELNTNGSPYISIKKNNLDLFTISNDTYVLHSVDWNGLDKGFEMNLMDGSITSFNKLSISGTNGINSINLSTEGDPAYFKISRGNLDLIKISDDDYILNSVNYIDKTSGTSLDLQNGKIRSYGFDLKAVVSSGRYAGSAIRITDSSEKDIENNSNELSPFFRIWHQENGKGLALIEIGVNKYILQSMNWEPKTTSSTTYGIIKPIGGAQANVYSVESSTSNSGTIYQNTEVIILSVGASRTKIAQLSGVSIGWVNNSEIRETRIDTSGYGTGSQINLNTGIITLLSNSGKLCLDSTAALDGSPFNISDKFKVGWDGSLSIGTEGAFKVSSSGVVTMSSLNIGENFQVDNTGSVTAKSLSISDKYIQIDGTNYYGKELKYSKVNILSSGAELTSATVATGVTRKSWSTYGVRGGITVTLDVSTDKETNYVTGVSVASVSHTLQYDEPVYGSTGSVSINLTQDSASVLAQN